MITTNLGIDLINNVLFTPKASGYTRAHIYLLTSWMPLKAVVPSLLINSVRLLSVRKRVTKRSVSELHMWALSG